MATSSEKTLSGLCVVLLLITTLAVLCESKHPEKIVAFFQGHCKSPNKECSHKCHDIQDLGYICYCQDGYKLNSDGFSCSVDPDFVSVEPMSTENADSPKLTQDNDHTAYTIHKAHDTDSLPIDDNVNILHGNAESQSGSSDVSNQPKDKLVQLHAEHSAKKTKSLQDSQNQVLVPTEPEIKIKTIDLKQDLPDPISYFHIREGGDNSLDLEQHAKYRFGKGEKLLPEKVTCSGIDCTNNGTCTVEGGIPQCNCPLGTTGIRCEILITVRYPKFRGTGFLALPVLRNAHKEFRISLEFLPEAKHGLLLFSAEIEGAKADFFSVSLVDGFVELRFDCGTGLGVVRSPEAVTIGRWNYLTVWRDENKGGLQVNQQKAVEGRSKGAYSRITLRLNLFLGGYSNMSAVVSRTMMRKRFVGCVQELIINGYKYDMRKGNLVGDSEFGINVGECSEGICDNILCQNGGSCQPRSADAHVCLCPLGTAGDFCQKRLEVHIPKFGGHSYLTYNGLDRKVLSYTDIEIVLKPSSPEGLILYNGYTHDRIGDFVSLAMKEGFLEFRFDLGTGPAVLRSLKPVPLNRWHVVRASRTGLQGILQVDDQPKIEGDAQGAYTQLTLMKSLYVGGHKNFDETSKYANVSQSFAGCIQKVIINKRPLMLMKDMLDGVNIEPCSHPCAGDPCMNSGECVPRRDVYTCYCPLGYANTNCEDKMKTLPSIPMFIGTSFLMYTNKDVLKRVTGDRIDVQFHIKPQDKNGLLFWSGQNSMTSSSDFIALGFVNGGLQFRYNLGSGEAVIGYNDSRLFDGQWHFIRAQRDKQDAYLEIDGSEIVEGSAPGSYTMLNTNKILYIGGMPDVTQKTLGKFHSGYVGCIRGFVLATDFKVKLVSHAQSGRNMYDCVDV
ncbi:pikachurin-like [Gigantopelta aegis]|uniref:pikachurin-like n=1 Tax=Gigantopelta aegis TaxID=1735272 RepID=UPI001B8881AB|nr:pikachurin-like [Gigantopelta aegis]